MLFLRKSQLVAFLFTLSTAMVLPTPGRSDISVSEDTPDTYTGITAKGAEATRNSLFVEGVSSSRIPGASTHRVQVIHAEGQRSRRQIKAQKSQEKGAVTSVAKKPAVDPNCTQVSCADLSCIDGFKFQFSNPPIGNVVGSCIKVERVNDAVVTSGYNVRYNQNPSVAIGGYGPIVDLYHGYIYDNGEIDGFHEYYIPDAAALANYVTGLGGNKTLGVTYSGPATPVVFSGFPFQVSFYEKRPGARIGQWP